MRRDKSGTPKDSRPKGSPADKLVKAFIDQDESAFIDLAEDAIASNRQGVLDMAARKISERYEDQVILDFQTDVAAIAQAAPVGDSDHFNSLIILSAAVVNGSLPSASDVGPSLLAANVFHSDDVAIFYPSWYLVDDVVMLNPCQLRITLGDITAGRGPTILAGKSVLEAGGALLVCMVGVVTSRPEPDDELTDDEEELEKEDVEVSGREAAFAAWNSEIIAKHPVIHAFLRPVPPSELAPEIDDFLHPIDDEEGDENDAAEGDIDKDLEGEIQQFVAVAKEEAKGEEVVCVPNISGDGVELALFTASGIILDTLPLSARRIGVQRSQYVAFISDFVRIVEPFASQKKPSKNEMN